MLTILSRRQEGFHAFYKGITPRIMRVAPGQAVTFTVYEYLKQRIELSQWSLTRGKYEEWFRAGFGLDSASLNRILSVKDVVWVLILSPDAAGLNSKAESTL